MLDAVKRDRWGRYLLPDPGEPGATSDLAWTRATTFCKSVADTFGLAKWQTRMAVKGLTMRPDLFALAASAKTDDKTTLDQVSEAAKEAAGTSAGANSGTALHTFTERVDLGEQVVVPPPWDQDVAAYSASLTGAGITVIPEYIERIVVVPKFNVAGTLDRVVRLPDGRLAIGDLKTGKDLSYGWLEIAIQLALYANAEALWNPDTGKYDPMPAVDKNTAIVMHLPVGKARCDLYEVDIAAGWEAAEVCASVRSWRTRKGLATKFKPTQPVVSTTEILAEIEGANHPDQLVSIWQKADWLGAWTPELTVAAAARKKQLAA